MRPISDAGGSSYVALQAEYFNRHRQVPQDILRDHGGYAYLLWKLDKRWATGLRGEMVTGLDNDPLDPEWTDARRRYSGQVSYYPTEFSRIRTQVNHDRPGWRDPYWGAFIALELVAGAHGAHSF